MQQHPLRFDRVDSPAEGTARWAQKLPIEPSMGPTVIGRSLEAPLGVCEVAQQRAGLRSMAMTTLSKAALWVRIKALVR